MLINTEKMTAQELVTQLTAEAPEAIAIIKASASVEAQEKAAAENAAALIAAKESGKTEAMAAMSAEKDAAASAERARIVDIQSMALPGMEALAQEAIANGKSAGDFAIAQAKAQKGKGEEALKNMQSAEEKTSQVGASSSDNSGNLTPEAQAVADIKALRSLGLDL
jgi:hypothetical protein